MKRKKGKNKGAKAKRQKVVGILSTSSNGYGFLTVEGFDRDIFVPQQFIGKALDRDKVEAELLPDRRSDGFIARIIKVIERGRQTITGVLLAGNRLRAFSKKITDDIIVRENLAGAQKGDWVEVELDPKNKKFSGKVANLIGRAGDIQADISAIIAEYGILPPYTDEKEERALQIEPIKLERKRFDNALIFTVDPEDAKDFDDAISVRFLPNGNYELGVHISDVAVYVQRGSWLDKEAFKRAFTSYLPGRTLPMLPKRLTEKISLKAERTSLAHSIIMEVCSESGKIISSKRFHSEIEVSARLSFDDVEYFIENGHLPEKFLITKSHNELAESLFRAIELYRLMRKNRAKEEEFLELETELVRAIVDEGGKSVKSLKIEKQREAEKLVEEFMLAANVEAAREISSTNAAGIYRVHPEPFPEKSEEFSEFIRSTLGFSPGDISSRKNCNRFLRSLPRDHRKPVIVEALLRAMARALYSEKHSLHFGLGKKLYAHFTSPIRRYPDLVLHQQFLALDRNEKLRSKAEIAHIATNCTEKELLNDESFWAANDRLKLHYLKENFLNRDDLFFEAVISKLTKSGLTISIPELGIRGEISGENSRGDERIRKRGKNRFVKDSRKYKAGQLIAVRLASVDFIKGRALFELI